MVEAKVTETWFSENNCTVVPGIRVEYTYFTLTIHTINTWNKFLQNIVLYKWSRPGSGKHGLVTTFSISFSSDFAKDS